jgi:exonuclease III
VHTHRPKLVFLCETRQNNVIVEKLRWRLGLKHFVSHHDAGKGGGLALFWDESVEVELNKIGNRITDVIIHDMPKEIKWRCMFVYGEPRTHLRYLFWDLLKSLKPMLDIPWLMVGDFNEAMWQEEHFSVRKRGEKQMRDFRETLSFCDLHDLGFVGKPWTFDNKQWGPKNVRVRLDRVVACPNWMDYFPDYQVHHLTSPRSDHCPLLISLFK